MRILVVGGAGYIGSALVPLLLKKTPYVTVIDTFWFGDNLPDHCKKINDDAANLTHAELKKYDVVIFLGGVSNDPMAEFAPFNNYVANAALPGWLAWMSAEAGVKRFIHGGSCSIYGRAEDVSEASSPKTFSPYGVSKLMAEYGVSQQAHHGLEVINFRMGTVCGYSPRMRFDLIINAMVKDAILNHEITVNDPTAERPILDIRDATRAYCAAMDEDLKVSDSGFEILNLVSENARVMDIAKLIQTRIKSRYGYVTSINSRDIIDVRSYTAKGYMAKTILRFEPMYHLKDTIDNVISHFSSIEDPESDNYYNIRVLKKIMAPPVSSSSEPLYRTPVTAGSKKPIVERKAL